MKNVTKLTAALVIAVLTNGCVKGETGSSGASSRVVRSIYCQGPINNAHPDIDDLNVEYNAVVTSVGDVYATASIIDDSEQTSGTSFYASAEANSGAAVNITADYSGAANEGYWTITLNRNTLITNVIYDDQSLPAPISMNFAASACTVRAF